MTEFVIRHGHNCGGFHGDNKKSSIQSGVSVKGTSMVWLDNSRIIAIFAVVFLHAAGGVVNISPVGTESWWVGNFYDSLVRWCVPVFVMISGALLLDPSKKEDLKTFYLKRLSKILIPILFWSAFFLMWAALKGVMKGEALEIVELAKRLLSGLPYYHMWFFYMIACLYIFTPFIRKIISNSSRFEIIVLVIISFVFSGLNAVAEKLGLVESNLFINLFVSYIPYFILGYFVRTSEINYPKHILWGLFSASVFLTALGCYAIARTNGLEAGLYFYSYLSITVIPMSVSIIYLMKRWVKPIGNEILTKKISSLTLGIYLIHPVFLDIIRVSGYGPLAFNEAISIPIISVVVSGLSLCVAWAISKMPYIKRVI